MGAGNQKPQKIAISGEIDHTVIKDRHFNDKYIMTPIEIGRGANAIVMMATCKTNNKVVVVKKIKNDKTERTRQMIKKECEISIALKHPHILEFYDYFENEDETYLVCEYCQGGELYDLIRDTKIKTRRGITEELARQYLAQIISAVEYMHCNMIAHRDLKPENILLDKDKKNIKICDFGMAAIVNSENYVNRRYSCCGSPGYFAPEIMKDYYQPLTSEVWSLGIVLYSMLAGEMPFGSGEQYMAKMRDEQAHYLCPAYFSADVKNLLSKMLVFNPNARISLSKVKEHAWMMGSALPQKKYPVLKLVEVWKLKYMVHLGYDADEIYKAIIENNRDSMFVAMYHNLKPVHVPEVLRPNFDMDNSSADKWKKIDKKSKSDSHYKYNDLKVGSVGSNNVGSNNVGSSNVGSNKLPSEIKIVSAAPAPTEEKPKMQSSIENFSLVKQNNETKKEPQKSIIFGKKNHSFLDDIINSFTDENLDNSSDSSDLSCLNNSNNAKTAPVVPVDVSFDKYYLHIKPRGSTGNKVHCVNDTKLNNSENDNQKRSSSPFMKSSLSPKHSPLSSYIYSQVGSQMGSQMSSQISSQGSSQVNPLEESPQAQTQQNSPLRSLLQNKNQKSAEKLNNNNPNRFQRFESITRRASDIFRSKKKPIEHPDVVENTDAKLSNSVDSERVSSMLIPPIDKLMQNKN